MKFNSDLTSLLWASYLGGSSDDAAFSVKLDQNNNLFVAGGTASSNFPINGSSFNGSVDGFIVNITNNGTSIQDGVFVGTSSQDQIYLLEIDKDNDIYVVGQTEGNWPIVNPLAGPVYQNAGAKQFVRKYNNALSSVVYSTVFGTPNRSNPQLSPTALLVDRCDNVYVTGWGGITNNPDLDDMQGMPTTADALQSSTDGSDFYLIVLSRDAQSLEFGTYFGGNDNGFAGDHVDGGTSRFDKNGVVYHAVCASCGGTNNFPTTPGVVSTTNNSSNCNLALFKIAFDLAGIEAQFTPLDQQGDPISQTVGCAPLTVNFDNNSIEGANPGNVTYSWDFDFNGDQSTLEEPQYTYTDPGTYEVMLIISDPTSCNEADTAFRTIEVFPPPAVDAGPDITVCAGDTFTLSSPSLGADFRWAPTAGIIGPDSIATIQASIGSTTDFILTLTDNRGCVAADTV
ncbi:MAG: PKD domain-containing protein, partial [Bacteroidota bacterium]